MRRLSVAVIGAGPAGLLAARLLARSPRFAVTVYERQQPVDPRGFGVGLAYKLLHTLETCDPAAASALRAVSYPLDTWTITRAGRAVPARTAGAPAVGRTAMLAELGRLAEEAGARVRTGLSVSLAELSDADVVIAADGAGSSTRAALGEALGARDETVQLAYIWCGAQLPLESMTLHLESTPEGIFTAHVMPYGDNRTTFQIDGRLDTVAAAGFGVDGAGGGDPDAVQYLEQTFAGLLQGRRLVSNHSQWRTFRVIRCATWSHGKVMLVGDAAHTAHYTVGSGTRMAMEDAIALAGVLAESGGPGDAFAAYEAQRRPAVEHLQWRAGRSERWWRSLACRIGLELEVLVLSYLTRTGGVDLATAATGNPELIEACKAAARARRMLAFDPTIAAPCPVPAGLAEVERSFLEGRLLTLSDRSRSVELACDGIDPWSAASAAAATRILAGAPAVVVLRGSPQRCRFLDRFDIAEEIRAQAGTGCAVAVALSSADLGDAACAVACARVDYVVLEDGS